MFTLRQLHNLFYPKVGEVWMLHRVVERRSADPRLRALEVERHWLEAKIDALLATGVGFCAIGDVPQRLATHTPFVCITFDDGYLDTYTHAYPLLRQRQVPMCVYATRNYYRGTARPIWDSSAPMMNAQQLLSLAADPLCTIGVHTCSHPRLGSLAPSQQWSEIADCKHDLEQLLGSTMQHLAYPFGNYNRHTVGICRQLGIATAATANGRTVRTDATLLELDRINVVQP